MSLAELILLSLASWRLASLLVNEDGPGAIFAKLRYRAGIRYVVRQGANGQPDAARTAAGWLAEGLTCLWCVSVWCAAGLVLIGLMLHGLGAGWLYDAGVLVLAASAGAIAMQNAYEWMKHDTK